MRRKNSKMKKMLRLVGLVLLGVIIAPFVKPLLSKIPLLNKLPMMGDETTNQNETVK